MITLKPNEKLCPRCRGAKKMYKTGGGYSSMNTGGKLVDCPCCMGVGAIKTLEAAVAEIPMLQNVSYETVEPPKNKGGRPKKDNGSIKKDEHESTSTN